MIDPSRSHPAGAGFDAARLDPHAREAVRWLTAPDKPRMEMLQPEAARRVFAKGRFVVQSAAPEVGEVWDTTFAAQARRVPARFYRGLSAPPAAAPCLLVFHGGGWMLGDLDSHDRLCRRLANAGACALVSVDYALAPEHPFPAAFDEAVAALAWLGEDGLGGRIDRSRIAVGGDSAGGNLAAALCLVRDGHVPRILLQVLLYPVTDCALSQPAHAACPDDLPLSGTTMRWFRDHYISDPGLVADWRASPLDADLEGGPSAVVVTAGFDPLRDDGVAYAAKLARSGVSVAWQHYAGQIHGFLTLDRLIPAADHVIDAVARELRNAFDLREEANPADAVRWI